MKAAVWHGRQDVRIEEVRIPPDPPPRQVQIEVAWCGICGTDLHEYLGGPIYIPQNDPHPLTTVRAPVIIGHEMSGRVVALVRVLRMSDSVIGLQSAQLSVAKLVVGADLALWPNVTRLLLSARVGGVGRSRNG